MNDDPTSPAVREAQLGDLRPQVNPLAASWRNVQEFPILEPVLLNRFFHLSRPIADASAEPEGELRLEDAGRFFYLVDALRQIGSQRLEETLLMILDEFGQLDQRSYDELYLFSIVHLSRLRLQHVETFWPMVVALDLRFRSAPWQRPEGVGIVERPYQLTELLCYYYVLYTLQRKSAAGRHTPAYLPGGAKRIYPSLTTCLLHTVKHLSGEQKQLLEELLRELARQGNRVAFGDAYGRLVKPK